MKTAVVSAAYGVNHGLISQISFQTFRRYAEKTGSDFITLTERQFPRHGHHGFEKLQIGDLLATYDAVLWIDNDAVILSRAPSIFEVVPGGSFAAWDYGGRLFDDDLAQVSSLSGVPFVHDRSFGYFNSGVFVAWKDQAPLFDKTIPEAKGISKFGEQTLLNLRVAHLKLPFHSLESRWNNVRSHMPHIGVGDSYIVHFAGLAKNSTLLPKMLCALGESSS